MERDKGVAIVRGPICDGELQAMMVMMRRAVMILAVIGFGVVIAVVVVITVMLVRVDFHTGIMSEVNILAQGSCRHSCENAESDH